MPVTGYVGLPGSGKTLKVVRRGLEARKMGREVYANFRLGRREWGFLRQKVDGSVAFVAWPALKGSRLRAFVEAQGVRVGRGFVPDPGAHVLSSWDDLINLKVLRDDFMVAHKQGCRILTCDGCSRGITVLLDELNLWAPSRLWQELGLGVLNRWAYVRKDGLEIVWTAQHESRIDKVAREVTDFIWNCRAYGGTIRLGGLSVRLQLFHRTKYVPALITDKNRTQAAEGAKKAGIAGDFEWGLFDAVAADSYDTYEHVAESGHVKGAAVVQLPRRQSGQTVTAAGASRRPPRVS